MKCPYEGDFSMFRRIIGLVILLATLVVLIALFAAAYYFGPALDAVADSLDNSLTLTVETLETVTATLEQTQSSLLSINTSLDTAAQTTANLSTTVVDTIPLLEQVAVVVSDQLPENIENIQEAIPNIVAVATVVDNTLTRLAAFEINQTIPIPFNPIEIQYDLGIEYDPEVPFGDSMEQLGEGLNGLPEELRALRGELEISAANLQALSDNLDTASGDIAAINAELAKFIPLMDQYLDLVDQVVGGIEKIRTDIVTDIDMVKMVGTAFILALALTQLAPLFVGLDMLTARYEPQVIVKEVLVEQDSSGLAEANSQIEEIGDVPSESNAQDMGEKAA
jgi:hypothetical protein